GYGCHSRHAPEVPGNFNQLIRVIGGFAAGIQDEIVAGALAFDAHSARRDPNEWIEPVKGANQSRDGVGKAIPTCDMCQLVHQYDATALNWPLGGFSREQDHRPPPAPRHRNDILRRLQQGYTTTNVECTASLCQEDCPVAVLKRLGMPGQPGDTQMTQSDR